MLGVGDGQELYWETCGNPDGLPALFLHGGPGSGCSPGQRRLFGPDRFRAVLFDQRGSGRSRPLPDGPNPDLTSQTTHALIEDIEVLRRHLGVERWTILGMSWGTTLGLAYAQAHPDRVAGLVLALVTTTSRREVEWITEGVGRIFPEAWERFAGAVPEPLRGRRLVDAYATMLADPSPELRAQAAREWCRWEDAHVSLTPGHAPSPSFDDPDFRLRFARLVTHYWQHAAFLEEEQLIRDVPVLDGIPGVMIHGRLDVSSPLETPWMLSTRWDTGRLRILDNAGHGGDSLIDAVLEGLDEVSA
jgi:proline iminopeptidase